MDEIQCKLKILKGRNFWFLAQKWPFGQNIQTDLFALGLLQLPSALILFTTAKPDSFLYGYVELPSIVFK